MRHHTAQNHEVVAMAKRLIQLGVCVLLAGCAGTKPQWLASKASNPATTAEQQVLRQRQVAQQQPATPAAASPAASQESGFSVGKMLEFVGFRKQPAGQASSTQPAVELPSEVTQLGNLINEVAARTAELNAHDPPETTRQKALGILQALQHFDGQVAQGQASGSLNEGTSQLLNSLVGQIRSEAQQLVQYVPTPESIAAVKQTAGSLYTAGQTLGGVLQQFNAIPGAFANQATSNPLLR
jgi:hypothetical protein